MSMQTPVGEINVMSLLYDPNFEDNQMGMEPRDIKQPQVNEVVELEQPHPVKVAVVVEQEKKKPTANASCHTHVN